MCPIASGIAGFGSHACFWIRSGPLKSVFHLAFDWGAGEGGHTWEVCFPVQSCAGWGRRARHMPVLLESPAQAG